MKIQYLGTAAAEGTPALFCNCKICTRARELGGKEFRTRSQALIDGNLLIDFPADTYMHCLNNGIDLTTIKNVLITHNHSDHLYVDDIVMRFPGFSNQGEENPITFFGTHGVMQAINGHIYRKNYNPSAWIKTQALVYYQPEMVGEYRVTALEAVHDQGACPAIYIIENPAGKRLLYAHDTDYFKDSVWAYLEQNPMHFDFVSLDCTNGNMKKVDYIGHMSLDVNIRVKERLMQIGCADEKTVFCCNHFSHNADDVLYETFAPLAEKEGFLTSYDGMEVSF